MEWIRSLVLGGLIDAATVSTAEIMALVDSTSDYTLLLDFSRQLSSAPVQFQQLSGPIFARGGVTGLGGDGVGSFANRIFERAFQVDAPAERFVINCRLAGIFTVATAMINCKGLLTRVPPSTLK